MNRFALADDALLEALFHLHQLLPFTFEHSGDGNSGPRGDNLSNILLGHLFV